MVAVSWKVCTLRGSLAHSLLSHAKPYFSTIFISHTKKSLYLQTPNMAQMKLLLLLLLVVLPSFSLAKISVLPSRFATKQAEKLIQELNLFPKESDNIVDRDPFQTDDEGSRIVEKRFSFPNLANSSVTIEDLGHHAGYYKIKHSHAAR